MRFVFPYSAHLAEFSYNVFVVSGPLMIAPRAGMAEVYLKTAITSCGLEMLYSGIAVEIVSGGISIQMKDMINWKRNSTK